MLPERKFRIISGLGLAAAALAATALGAVPARAAATLTTLYSFCAQPNCTDGDFPVAGLIADAAGNLFGTTAGGGANRVGTVFEIAKTASGYASTPTVLHSFCAQPNCADGQFPTAGLIADAAGNLFGTTFDTVFEIAKTASGYASAATVLATFYLGPVSGLIADAAGNLFGTTQFGGANDAGTVFELAKTASGYASTPTILYSFGDQAGDGLTPVSGLIADAAGNLFGTTPGGGAAGQGTVFELAKTASGYASAVTVLYSFCPNSPGACTDGNEPAAGLIADAAGNLFGTTQFSGANGAGTVFEIAKTASGYASTPTILYSFCAQPNCADGGGAGRRPDRRRRRQSLRHNPRRRGEREQRGRGHGV